MTQNPMGYRSSRGESPRGRNSARGFETPTVAHRGCCVQNRNSKAMTRRLPPCALPASFSPWFCVMIGAGAEGQLSPGKDEEVTRQAQPQSKGVRPSVRPSVRPALPGSGRCFNLFRLKKLARNYFASDGEQGSQPGRLDAMASRGSQAGLLPFQPPVFLLI